MGHAQSSVCAIVAFPVPAHPGRIPRTPRLQSTGVLHGNRHSHLYRNETMQPQPHKNLNPSVLLLTGSLLLASASVSVAGPADKVYRPFAVAGATEVEFRGGYEDADSGANPYQTVLDFGYGVNDSCVTELERKSKRMNSSD